LRDRVGAVGPAREHPEQSDRRTELGERGGGRIVMGCGDRFDPRLLWIAKHCAKRTTLRFEMRSDNWLMPKPTPLPGRPVRGSTTGRPIMALLDLLGRRWALRVIWELRNAPSPNFRELQRRCGGISSSVLAARLRELTEAGVVERAADGYLLTSTGRDLVDRLQPLEEWSAQWTKRLAGSRGG
jgi:DNA-binding HxlR family transcriptional regulator